MLWVHDEMFSKEDVVLDLGLFPHGAVKSGDLMAIVALKTDSAVRDFPDKNLLPKKEDVFTPAKGSESSPSAATRPSDGPAYAAAKHDVDVEKPYLFVAKGMSADQKAKHPSLEVSIAKSIADVFGLKNRTSVLLKTVSLGRPGSLID